MERGTILLSAGGTGGHLFPAEALAHELAARGWMVELATDSRAERFAGAFPARAIHAISSATPSGKNPFAFVRAGLSIWRGVREASAVIAKIRPAAVVGFGGYPTIPPVWAAARAKVPSLVHEQNAVMGRANRALAGRVMAIAGGFLAEQGAHAAKIVVTGNPVRQQVIEAAKTPFVAPGPRGRFRLLVFGGSQGALFFSEAVPAAVARLSMPLRKRLVVTQQARAEDEEGVRRAYAELGVEADIAPFFTDLAARMGAAHLVVSRSGASTVSEIAAIGRPAILVPYPYALDHDQAANAAALAATGGAELHAQSTLSPDKLASLIETAMGDPAGLERRAEAARSAGKPEATRLLADLVEAIACGHTVAEYKRGARP